MGIARDRWRMRVQATALSPISLGYGSLWRAARGGGSNQTVMQCPKRAVIARSAPTALWSSPTIAATACRIPPAGWRLDGHHPPSTWFSAVSRHCLDCIAALGRAPRNEGESRRRTKRRLQLIGAADACPETSRTTSECA